MNGILARVYEMLDSGELSLFDESDLDTQDWSKRCELWYVTDKRVFPPGERGLFAVRITTKRDEEVTVAEVEGCLFSRDEKLYIAVVRSPCLCCAERNVSFSPVSLTGSKRRPDSQRRRQALDHNPQRHIPH